MEDWDDDTIESCIAHLRSLHVVPQRSADSVDTGASARVSRPARKCTKAAGTPAPSAVCKFGPDPPGFSRHLRKHQDKNCARCLYARNRSRWKRITRMGALGLSHSWLQVKPVASESWGVGCRVCRWYRHRSGIPGAKELGRANLFVNTTVTGSSIQASCLHMHARNATSQVGNCGSAEPQRHRLPSSSTRSQQIPRALGPLARGWFGTDLPG